MSQLFENSDSDGEQNRALSTAGSYAKNYDSWRQKEELHKLHMKYASDTASSSSSEDDEEEAVDENFERAFLRTLSCLKNKDPRIYENRVAFFHGTPTVGPRSSGKKKEQPMYLKDYERKMVLDETLGGSNDRNDNANNSLTYVQEQEHLKETLKEALDKVKGGDKDGWGGLFEKREKSEEEQKREQEDYIEWLGGHREHLADEVAENELRGLKDYWADPKLDKGEAFLRDYILNKRFLNTDNADYIPTYDEVIHDSDGDLSEDERAVERQDEFEHKYNFRFEEPDQEFIKRYPRVMENSVRRKDEKRSEKRAEVKERKKREKHEKMEEIRQLKAMKRKEVEEKIAKLKEVAGDSTEVEFKAEDLEDDFDPEAHDRRMQNLFSNEFYAVPEGHQKPQFPDLDKELELENWDRWNGTEEIADDDDGEAENRPHCEDEDFNMDAEYTAESLETELVENTRRRKKKQRRKSKFAKAVAKTKPAFDPKDMSYQQYLDEYYKLDCEDIVGDVPCRFKYREVMPNSFGLSIEEILLAKDKELNRWCSLKKAVQRRPDHVEKYDVLAFEKRGQNEVLKRRYLPSLFGEAGPSSSAHINDGPQLAASPKKSVGSTTEQDVQFGECNIQGVEGERKRKKKDVADKSIVRASKKREKRKTLPDDPKSGPGKKRKKLKKGKGAMNLEIGISDARLCAFGINPKKFKNKLKYKDNNNA